MLSSDGTFLVCISQELVMKDASTASQEWYQYHLRAVNAAIGLQAFALRDIKSRSV